MRKLPSPKSLTAAAGLLTAAAALAVTAAPASAAPQVRVAAGPDGSAHFSWPEMYAPGFQVHERRLDGDGSLSAAQSVSWAYRHVADQAIGVDDAGNALIAWAEDHNGEHPILARRRTTDGTLGPVQRITPDGVSVNELRLAVEPDGDAVVAWSRFLPNNKHVIQARRRAANGTLSQTFTLSYAGGQSFYPAVGVAPDGTATFAWMRAVGADRYIQTRTIAPDNSVSDSQRVSAISEVAGGAHVTVSDAGTAVLGWVRRAPAGLTFESRRRTTAGTLTAVQTVAAPEDYVAYGTMASNGEGRTAYTWAEALPPGQVGYKIMGRIRQANGALGSAFEVDAGSSADPRVAMDRFGTATFAWTAREGDLHSVETRRRTAAGALEQVRPVSDLSVDSRNPQLAVGDDGKAVIAWAVGSGEWYARIVPPSGAMSTLKHLSAG